MNKNLYMPTIVGFTLFVLLFAYGIFQDINANNKNKKNIQSIQKRMDRIIENSDLIIALQKERGLSSIYLANKNPVHFKVLLEQREETSKLFTGNNANMKQVLQTIRENVVSKDANRFTVFYTYTEVIKNLYLDIESLSYNASNKLLKNELMIYNDLNYLQEILGQLRANVATVLASGNLSTGKKTEIRRLNDLITYQLQRTFKNDIIASRNYTKEISKAQCVKESLRMADNLASVLKGQHMSALECFKVTTCAINQVNTLVEEQHTIIHKFISMELEKAQKKRIEHITFWVLGAFFFFILTFVSYKNMKRLAKERAILKNYKKAIDYASLVSTADKDGNITHINNNFSELSGYTEDELLGKKHSYISHPDMKPAFYKNMWKKLSHGDKWSGVIKNRTKNGSVFWEHTAIIPILDDNETLTEYIALRHDMSETILLHEEIEETQRELIYRLGDAVESRSKESGNHIKRVSLYSKLLAELKGLSEEECRLIFSAASMHDVGKIAIPDDILLKPGKLTDNEWKVMKTHSKLGYNIFKDSNRPILKTAADIAHEHHEMYNGKGYPRGLKGDAICIAGRIVAIVDVFDALISERCYKKAWSLEDTLALMKKEAGEQFDPELIELFLNNLDQFLAIKDTYK